MANLFEIAYLHLHLSCCQPPNHQPSHAEALSRAHKEKRGHKNDACSPLCFDVFDESTASKDTCSFSINLIMQAVNRLQEATAQALKRIYHSDTL